MPITLGCPSCGKRFRARDESAGKKVKCPYCQSAVQVPTAEESATAGAPTAPLPPPSESGLPAASLPRPPATPSSRAGSAPVVASPDAWGALPTGPAPKPLPSPPPPTYEPEPLPKLPPISPRRIDEKERPKPVNSRRAEETPDEYLAGAWKRVRRGLFWVQFALLWLALLGFVEFGKAMYERSQGPLPRGDGKEWVSIEGFVNSDDKNAIPLRKEQIIDLAAYGIPIAFAGLLLVFGRLVASGGPRMSGSRGLFALSSLFTLLSLIAVAATVMFVQTFPREGRYATEALLIAFPLAEFLFLIGLTASGLALKKPGTARRVGFLALVTVVVAFLASARLWESKLYADFYVKELRPQLPAAEVPLIEMAAVGAGWLLIVLAYWFAVRSVRVAAREFMDTVAEKA